MFFEAGRHHMSGFRVSRIRLHPGLARTTADGMQRIGDYRRRVCRCAFTPRKHARSVTLSFV
jgi:hypothetical protein